MRPTSKGPSSEGSGAGPRVRFRRRRCRWRRAIAIPGIEDLRGRPDSADRGLAEPRAGPLSWENPFAWRIEYRSEYSHGLADGRVKARAMPGNSEGSALLALRKLEAGFGAVKIILYAVRPPQSTDEIERVRGANEWLRREKEKEKEKEGQETDDGTMAIGGLAGVAGHSVGALAGVR